VVAAVVVYVSSMATPDPSTRWYVTDAVADAPELLRASTVSVSVKRLPTKSSNRNGSLSPSATCTPLAVRAVHEMISKCGPASQSNEAAGAVAIEL
jgi:hypothetical protein